MFEIDFQSTLGEDLGHIRQDAIPRQNEEIHIIVGDFDKKYIVSDILWTYTDPRKIYPDDPLTLHTVVILLWHIISVRLNSSNPIGEKKP